MKKFVFLIVHICCMLAVSTVQAKTGSYTFFWDGLADPSTVITVTAKAEDGSAYNEAFVVGGQTSEQTRNTIMTDLQSAGWNVTANGPNGIIITGHGSPNSPVSEVDIHDTRIMVVSKADGNVTINGTTPGARNIGFSFDSPDAGMISPGFLTLELNTYVLTAQLAPGDNPLLAAQKIHAALISAGFNVSLAGNTVNLDWDDPVNFNLLGEDIHINLYNLESESGPHMKLILPDSIQQSIPTLSQWGLIILASLLLITASFFILKRGSVV